MQKLKFSPITMATGTVCAVLAVNNGALIYTWCEFINSSEGLEDAGRSEGCCRQEPKALHTATIINIIRENSDIYELV